jgi:hypothetical protein
MKISEGPRYVFAKLNYAFMVQLRFLKIRNISMQFNYTSMIELLFLKIRDICKIELYFRDLVMFLKIFAKLNYTFVT